MKDLIQLNKKQLLKILAILVLSDGHLYKHKDVPKNIRLVTSFFGEDQHILFKFLCNKIFSHNVKRRTAIRKLNNQKVIISDYNYRNDILLLYSLSPEYNTTPGNKSKADYLGSLPPTLNFMFNENKSMKWLALRTYFDFDGSISPTVKLKLKKDKREKKIYEYYQVQFECEIKISETNPFLVQDLLTLCEQLGIKATIRKDKRNWSNISGICISGIGSVKEFLKKGGPITGVLISGKSNRFKGIPKKMICQNVYELITNRNFLHSKSFKNKKEATEYRNKLNYFILESLNKKLKSPSTNKLHPNLSS
ncbi:hypothetical protein HOI26_03490 [Candidatus Woesearchaeota archaeon]|nr:hypothetical protein [Candidatus Woesearchaeota archaeon]MBT5740139.1 hypothetical protein [Candidatus Woesearchaeota archaeon]